MSSSLRAIIATVTIPAIVIAALSGCAESNKKVTRPDPDTSPACGTYLVVTTDFETGSLAAVDADSSFAVRPDLTAIHGDAVARVEGGLVYVVNRFGADNIQVIDPAAGFATIRQIGTGAGSNPHDIAFIAPDRAYVSRNGSASLLEINPQTGEDRGEISLAVLADADGIPDMDRMFYRAPYLYIAVQRVDFGGGTYLPVPPSYLAVLDTRDDSLVDADPQQEGIQGIALQGLNPSAPMVWDDTASVLLVPESGVYGVLDAGVEKVDLDARRSLGFLVREQELGGDLIDFALTGGARGYATVSDAAFVTSLVAFDRSTGAAVDTVYLSDGFDLSDLIVTCCGSVVVCDRDYASPGLRLFDGATGKPLSGVAQPIPTGLPPFEIVLLKK